MSLLEPLGREQLPGDGNWMEMMTFGWVALQGVENFLSHSCLLCCSECIMFEAPLSVSFAMSTEAKYATTSLQIKDAKA